MNSNRDTTGDPSAWAVSRRLRALVFLLVAGIAFSHAWNGSRRAAFSTASILQYDAVDYVALMRTADPAQVDAPFRYRLFTPLAARLVPTPPPWLLTRPRLFSADEQAVFAFAVVNGAGLAVAACFLLLLMERFGFGFWQGMSGALLFLSCRLPAGLAIDPLADAWGYGFLAAGLWGLIARRWTFLAVVFLAGLFNKETILLLPVAALLLGGWTRRERRLLLACFVPAAGLYAGFRWWAFPAPQPFHSLDWYSAWGARLFVSQEILTFPRDLLAAFGLLPIPAVAGWRCVAPGSALARLRPLLPITFLAPLLLIKGPLRTWFCMFPVMIPLAVAGLSEWLGGSRRKPSAS